MSETGRRNLVRWGLGIVAVAILAVVGSRSALAAELTGTTGGADNLRTGWYPDEPSLAPGEITKERFKQAFEQKLTGQIYAQPLVADGTLLVVTEDDFAYGLDPVTGHIRWERQFGTAVESGPEKSGKTIECPDLEPNVGITGTPVIDPEHKVAYFVAHRYVKGSAGEVGWYMSAVNLSSGEELPNFPVKIEGEATNLVSEKANFVPVQQLQRAGLLLMNGVVYAAFGSHCDRAPYEGWIVGVSSEGKVVTKWATSAHEGSIWQSGGGLVSDAPGQIVFTTGNGSGSQPGEWDAPIGSGTQTVPSPEGRLGESVVRVKVEPGGELATKDYFSPFNSKELDEKDLDLGSSAPVALPSPYFGNAKTPHVLVQEGKQGRLYLLNRDALGGREEASNHVVQEIPKVSSNGVFGAAAVWPGEGGYVITPSSHGHLHFFRYGEESGEPALGSETNSSEEMEFGSGSPIVTSNSVASGSGVLWINWCPKTACQEEAAELRAYNPAGGNEAKPIWQEKIGLATKFSRPGVSNGHIYVGNHEGRLMAFSGPALTPSSESVELTAPVGGQTTGEVTLDNTGSENEIKEVAAPAAPFEASGLPVPGSKLEPGATIKVTVVFKPASRGHVSAAFSIVTQAGETKVALSGVGEESAKEKAEREARERAEREAKERASSITQTVSNVSPIGGAGAPTVGPLLRLTNLKIRASASRLAARRRTLAVSYTLSAAGTVRVVIEHRVTSHRCSPGVRTCGRWVTTKLKLKVTGHVGSNQLTVALGTLPAGGYRLIAIPVNGSGVAGIRQTLEFRTSH